MNGTMDVSVDPLKEYGSFQQQTMARVRTEEDTLPFRVGTYFYYPDCGLYIILGYTKKEEKYLAEELLESLAYTGIGGKKSTGLGKYILRPVKLPEVFERHLKKMRTELFCFLWGFHGMENWKTHWKVHLIS